MFGRMSLCPGHVNVLREAGEPVERVESFAETSRRRRAVLETARQGPPVSPLGATTGRPPRLISQVTIREAEELRGEGLGWKALAARTGIPKDTLRRRLKKEGAVQPPVETTMKEAGGTTPLGQAPATSPGLVPGETGEPFLPSRDLPPEVSTACPANEVLDIPPEASSALQRGDVALSALLLPTAVLHSAAEAMHDDEAMLEASSRLARATRLYREGVLRLQEGQRLIEEARKLARNTQEQLSSWRKMTETDDVATIGGEEPP